MNKIFKIKRNHLGNAVVTSELAKNKGKIASLTLSSLLALGISSQTFAQQVSIEGIATGKDAVSIGENSYSTALDGVSTGQGSVSTGNGFTRDEFKQKVAENQEAVDAVKDKNTEINNNKNQLDATQDAIDALTNQINDLTNQQQHIADKIRQKDELENRKTDAENKVNDSQNTYDATKQKLDEISQSGKNIYLDFKDVLNSLNWSKLTQSSNVEANRNELATDLQNKIQANHAEIAANYDFAKYRAIIDGYLNRQASYQGSYEYLANATNVNNGGDKVRFFSDKIFFNDLYYNSSLNEENYLVLNNNYAIIDNMGAFRDTLHKEGVTTGTNFGVFYGSLITENNVKNNNNTSLNNYFDYGVSGFDAALKRSHFYDMVKNNEDKQKILNTLNLISLSKEKKSKENLFSPLMFDVSFTNGGEKYIYNTINNALNLKVGTQNFKDFYNNLIYEVLSPAKVNLGVKTRDSAINPVRAQIYDKNITILTMLQDMTVNNGNLISTNDIQFFRNFKNELINHYNNVDWDFTESAINLTDYRASLDKVIGYNNKIDNILTLYQNIIEERKKTDANTAQIDRWTEEMMGLKSEVLDGVSDKTNFAMGIELTYNKEWADHYINYAKDESDAMIKRINAELKLYNDKDQLIVDVTAKAKEIQNEYDAAAKKLADDKKTLDDLNKQIDNLALTETEKAVDNTKAEKEQEKVDREADKTRLEDEIRKGEEELEKLKEKLLETSLNNIGARSQAHGSEAFASGEDSIAMGTKATATANESIAIGKESNVSGEQSIAIGSKNNVSGNKSIAIGVAHTVSGNRSTTIGDPNTITGDDVFVAGNNNTVASNNVMVMGNNVNVAQGFNNAVVLGANSTVAKANPTSSITVRGTQYNFAGTNPTSTVSVGGVNSERQIVNVAAGRINSTSTDAINGSQLHAVADALENLKITTTNNAPLPINIKNMGGLDIIQDTWNGERNIHLGVSKTTYNVASGDNTHVIKTGGCEPGGRAMSTDITSEHFVGHCAYEFTVHADKTTVSAEGPLKITSETVTNDNGTVTTNYKLTLEGDFTTQPLVVQNTKEESVSAGSTNVKVKQEGTNETGGKNFVVDIAKDINLTNQGSLTIGGVKLSNTEVNVGGNRIQNVGTPVEAGDATTKQYVDDGRTRVSSNDGSVKIVKTVVDQATGAINYDLSVIQKNYRAGSNYMTVDGDTIDLSQTTKTEIDKISKGLNTLTDDGITKNRQLGDTVAIKGDDKNISTSTEANGTVRVKLKDNITAKSVKTGNVSISEDGVDAGSKKVTNVADGDINADSKDAINGSQLHNVLKQIHVTYGNDIVNMGNQNKRIEQVENKVDNLGKKVKAVQSEARKGIAIAGAIGMLPQPHISGKSMVSAATTNFKGQQAVAVGYSRLSDNGKHTIKFSGSGNVSGKKEGMVGAAYGYQW